jgi:hypothetical protein
LSFATRRRIAATLSRRVEVVVLSEKDIEEKP